MENKNIADNPNAALKRLNELREQRAALDVKISMLEDEIADNDAIAGEDMEVDDVM